HELRQPGAMTTESFRKDVAKKLSDLQSSSDEDAKIDFPSDLTSSDRKYIHKIAESFRLHTLSSGTGDARFISVYKNPPAGQEPKRPREAAGATPQLSLSAAASQNLQIASHAQMSGGRTLLAKDIRLTCKTYGSITDDAQDGQSYCRSQ
ncbi:unnamed protein product, partial [Cladocopium goreaui]